jgi:adenylate cyclase
VFSGRAAEAFRHLGAAIRLSPMIQYGILIADGKYFVSKYEAAVTFALKALGQPNFQWSRSAVLIARLVCCKKDLTRI